jgi:hypothetical protein
MKRDENGAIATSMQRIYGGFVAIVPSLRNKTHNYIEPLTIFSIYKKYKTTQENLENLVFESRKCLQSQQLQFRL